MKSDKPSGVNHVFFKLIGDKLTPCENYGARYHEQKQREAADFFAMLLTKRERRQTSKRRPKNKRMLGVSKIRPVLEFDGVLHDTTFIAHRFGVSMKRDRCSEVRCYATVYVEQGQTIPTAVKDNVIKALKRSVRELGVSK